MGHRSSPTASRLLAAATAPSALHLVGRFEILRELGRGGMGTVYEAVDHATGERLALKTLRHFDAEALYRFKREFRALADISHPNLVALYELYASDDVWYFTMERVDGVGLLPWVLGASSATPSPRPEGSGIVPAHAHRDAPKERAAFVPERLRDAFAQLARALLALHEAGRVHRDVKPSNVMVADGGRVVVLDFGIIAELGSTRVDDASIIGTPGYMAPEQVLLGTPPSPASDWYAFGVVLFEALAGRPPFVGSTTEILASKLAVEAPSLAALAPDAPPDLVALCGELLAAEPARRPSGTSVLRRLTGGAESPAGSTPPEREGPRLVGREADLAVLEAARGRARASGCQGVLLHGPSGYGKTTLVEAFLTRAEREGALVLRGRCFEQESVPYKGLDSLVDALSRALIATPSLAAACVPEDVGALAAAFPVLLGVPAIAVRAASPPSAAPKERAMRALLRLLGGLAEAREVVLAIDDLQFGDAQSAGVLVELLSTGPRGLLFLGAFDSAQDGERPLVRALQKAAKGGAVRLREHALARVTRAALRELALGILRGTPDASAVARRIAVDAGGSAHLAIELARHAARWGSSSVEGATLQAVLGARLAILSHHARRLVEVLAIAGAPLRRSVAVAVADVTTGARRTLAQLARTSFLAPLEPGDDPLLGLSHTAVGAAALAGMKLARRRAVHLALAEALAAGGRRDDSDVFALARHYREAWPAVDARTAIHACEAAATRATATCAFAVAYEYLLRARELAAASRTLLGWAFDFRLGEAAARAGHASVALPCLRRALERCGAPAARAQIRLAMARILLAERDARGALRQASEGLGELGARPSRGALVAVLVCVASLLLHAAAALLGGARGPRSESERTELRVRAALLLEGTAAAALGLDRRGQLVMLLRLLPTAFRLGEAGVLARARGAAALALATAGLQALPRRLLAQAPEAHREPADPGVAARAARVEARARDVLGEPCEAVRQVEESLAAEPCLDGVDDLDAVADVAGNLLLRGRALLGLRWIALGLHRARRDGDGPALAAHGYRCCQAPLLSLVGRSDEARQVLRTFGATLFEAADDPWRRGQWLAHRALSFAELGGDPAVFEQTVRAFRALGLSPRATPLQLRHFYLAQAMVRLAEHDGTRQAEGRWRSARRELARAAGSHPTMRAHLLSLDAAYRAWRGDIERAVVALDAAEELARAHDNPLVLWDVARQRALLAAREGDALGARRALDAAFALADGEGWTLRRARLAAAVKADLTDPRWPYGRAPRDLLLPLVNCL